MERTRACDCDFSATPERTRRDPPKTCRIEGVRLGATQRNGSPSAIGSTACRVGPNTSSKASRKAMSTSGMVTGSPRSARLVTPCSEMPQGTMPVKWRRSGSTLMLTPWKLTQRPHANSNCRDLVLDPGPFLGPRHPNADASRPHFALHVELRQPRDDPALQSPTKARTSPKRA